MTVLGVAEPVVSLVSLEAGPAAEHGLTKLREALAARGVTIESVGSPAKAGGQFIVVPCVRGRPGPGLRLHRALGVKAPRAAEALRIQQRPWKGRTLLLVSGADERGLMYALLDLADRVGWAADAAEPFSEVRNAQERPYVVERALSKYTFHRLTFESFFHDRRYWQRYLDTLAANRFNTFVLIFGYENWGYFAPPYPYFFDVEGFADIRVVGLDAAGQQRNLESLNRVIDMAHARGLNFTLGIWDHIYRGGVQGPVEYSQRPTAGLVWGLTPENLVAYNKAGLEKFLRLVPGIDGLQFRMHGESGLSRAEMHAFWPDIYRIVQTVRPGLRFDARAKEFPDALIDKALEMGLNFRIATKYWAEQMGLPFHPTHIPVQNQFDRRHGYADLLRHPRRYPMHWRLWTSGTTRVLLWGEPQYARRFAASTHLYDGQGYEVTEPLATKMQDHPHEDPPFELLNAKYRYYDYEFERYWHFFQVFGRIGYSPDTPPEVWELAFSRRLGREAGPLLMRALHRASWILPRINACIFPYNRSFPTTVGWAERSPRGTLQEYARAEASDTQQFQTIGEAVADFLVGEASPKAHPLRTSRWFAQVSQEVLDLVDRACQRAGRDADQPEFVSTVTDLRILAYLAMFHSRRILAGLAYALYERTHSAAALDDAIAHEQQAVEAWAKLAESAGDVYTDDVKMGARHKGMSGHWRDELAELNNGLRKLSGRKRDLGIATRKGPCLADLAAGVPDDDPRPVVLHEPIRSAPASKPLRIAATVRSPAGIGWVRLRYRGVNQTQDYRTLPMQPRRGGRYEATVPAAHILPEWDFMYLIEVMDKAGRGAIHPDLLEQTPYVVVPLRRGRQAPTVKRSRRRPCP
jgi:hypothetical protein